MDCFDKVEELLLAEGYTKEEIPEIMISLIEQGYDPTSVFLGGVANMLGFLPKKKKIDPKPAEPLPSEKIKGQGKLFTKSGKPQNFTGGRVPFTGTDPVPAASSKLPQPTKPAATSPGQLKLDLNKTNKPKITTPKSTGGLLGTTKVPTMKELGAAPKPAWTGSTGSGQSFPKPPRVNRDAGAFARQKMLLKTPTPTASTGVFSRLKGLRGSTPAQMALNLAAGEALDRYVTQPVAKAGGNALTRAILDATGKGEKARQINPQLYGKSGPTLTPEIMKAVQQRSKLTQQSAETQAASQPKPTETGERSAAANDTKQQAAKLAAQQKRVAAAKPAPAPKPEPVRQTGDKAKDRSTWRSANTRLSRVADMRKAGASREEINKVLYKKGTKAYGAK